MRVNRFHHIVGCPAAELLDVVRGNSLCIDLNALHTQNAFQQGERAFQRLVRETLCIKVDCTLNIVDCQLHNVDMHDALQSGIADDFIASDCGRRKDMIAGINILRECLFNGHALRKKVTVYHISFHL